MTFLKLVDLVVIAWAFLSTWSDVRATRYRFRLVDVVVIAWLVLRLTVFRYVWDAPPAPPLEG